MMTSEPCQPRELSFAQTMRWFCATCGITAPTPERLCKPVPIGEGD